MMMCTEFRRVIFVRSNVFHTVFKDLELAINVNQYTAEQTIANDVQIRAEYRGQDLMNKAKKKEKRWIVVIRYPGSKFQSSMSEVCKKCAYP